MNDEKGRSKHQSMAFEEGMFTPSPSSRIPSSGGRRDRSKCTPGNHDKPAELFRKDLISAMKLADSEHLEEKEYLVLQDPWREEWEKGVQVPVSLDAIPDLNIKLIQENELLHGLYGFKLPIKGKYLHSEKDDRYKGAIHELHESQKLADEMCRYDLDDLDVTWLALVNEERDAMGEEIIQEWVMEQVIEKLETQCYSNMQNLIKTVEGLGIEYDEDIVCDVCRSPEGEEGNEMVFCDSCDICVHQACYGIATIPDGSWLCRACATGVTPPCVLCPKIGGAMKSTKSGKKWAHVSCALWIPEVNFDNADKMEPISNISLIPASRWALICSVCREKSGACIQCSVKSCKTAFHVSCAFSANLDMKTNVNETTDQVQLLGFCAKHTKNKDGEKNKESPKKDISTPKKESEMTEKEKSEVRSARLEKLAEEFYTSVTVEEIAELLKLDPLLVDYIYAYWQLKRKASFNKALLTPKTEEAEMLSKQRDDSLIARMKMFIHLRQDLERVRNLCYMVSKREKISKHLQMLKREVFFKQVQVIDEDKNFRIGKKDMEVITQCHVLKNSVYDQHEKIVNESKNVEKRVAEEKMKELNSNQSPPLRVRIKYEPNRKKAEIISGIETLNPKENLENDAHISKRKRLSLNKLQKTSKLKDVNSVCQDNSREPKTEHKVSMIAQVQELSTLGKDIMADEAISNSPSPNAISKFTATSNLKLKDHNKLTPKELIEKSTPKSGHNMADQRRDLAKKDIGEEHIFRKSQLIVPSNIKDKIHTAFQLKNERRAKVNGLCYHAKSKLDKILKHQKENHFHVILQNDSSQNGLVQSSVINRQTRRRRRPCDSDFESDVNDSLIFDQVDGEVSLRLSPDRTPVEERTILPRRQRKRHSYSKKLDKFLSSSKRLRRSSKPLDSDTESGQEADSESDGISRAGNSLIVPRRSSLRRSSRRFEPVDEDSSQSTISVNSTRQASRTKSTESRFSTFDS